MSNHVRIKWSLYCAGACVRLEACYFFNPVLIGWLLLASFCAQAATFYVSPAGNDANNGTSWALSKQTIQAGINVATSGDTILVADGDYTPITITQGVTVRSVNGAQTTIIDGGGTRLCAYLDANAVLDGFTVINGYSYYGGGVYAYGGAVRNCMISGNVAYYSGGGVYTYYGTVEDCLISENTVLYNYYHYSYGRGGGVCAYYSTVQNCTISGNRSGYFGGGVYVMGGMVQSCTVKGNKAVMAGGIDISDGMVENCMISGNLANADGGGIIVRGGTVQNCMIIGNTAYSLGGGVGMDGDGGGKVRNCIINGNIANCSGGIDIWGTGTVENCTICGNKASYGSGGMCILAGTVRNCIAYYNQNTDVIGPISYSCIGTPNGGGVANITNEPQFVSIGTGYGANHVPGNYRLRPTSPSINAGLNQSWMMNATDLDGLPRILGGVVDMGAYECVGTNSAIMRDPAILYNQCDYRLNATGQTVEVWNAGMGTMAYDLSPNVNWLSLSPASGTSTGEIDLVNINYVSAGLVPGTYTSIVTITSAEAINSPQVVTVYLTVDEIPPENLADLEVSDLKFVPVNLWAGDHPAMISFDLINNGPRDIVAPGTQIEINFYLSSNTNFGDADDRTIGTTTEEITLSAGSQTTIRYPGRPHNTDVTIPEGLSGDFYVFVSVRLVSQSGLSDPDGAYVMRDGPIRVRIHPSDGGEDIDYRIVVNDYDGDGLSDMMAYDEASGEWAIRLSESGEWVQFAFGGPGYETAPGDYDGDIKTDPAVHNKNGSQWYVMLSGIEYQAMSFDFGGEGETKGAVGDYNGDNLADPALYEEANGRWYVLLPNTEHGNYETASVMFGGPGYTPVAGDYDGDGRADPAVYAEDTGEWRVMLSDKGYEVVEAVLGGPGFSAAVGDYDGDGKSDPAVVSASGGWYYLLSSRGYSLSGPDAVGKSGLPVPGDYDGDVKADPAIMSASGGWYFWLSGSSYACVGPYYQAKP